MVGAAVVASLSGGGLGSPTILFLQCLVSLMELLHDFDAECFRGSGGGRRSIVGRQKTPRPELGRARVVVGGR